MPSPLSIREIAQQDFSAWKPLWDGYNSFYGRAGATALPDEITQSTWARFFDTQEPVRALVATQGDDMLGIAHYLFHRSTTSIGDVCYLQDLFTVEAARGKGVGRALIHVVYEKAQAAGAPRVYWNTYDTNHTAMRLYDSVAEKTGIVVYRHLL